MATQLLLVRIPEELARRLLEQTLAPEGGEDDPLCRAAMAVEADERLTAEMTDWDSTVADGLEGDTFAAHLG